MKHNYLKHLFTALLLLCTTVATAHDFEVGGIYYNITNSTTKKVAVTYSGSYSSSVANEYTGNVVIPESVTYNGTTYSVTSIGDGAFSNCTGLTGISIPDGVISIGEGSFINCTGLTDVVIPNTVTSIGTVGRNSSSSGAFEGCINLTSVKIPNGVTTIGEHAFIGCTKLEYIEIPSSVIMVGVCAFHNTAWFEQQQDGLVYIGDVLYCYKGKIPVNAEINIKEGTKAIAEYAFAINVYEYESELLDVTIPNSVTHIARCAFFCCSKLKIIIIPENVIFIGNQAFDGCDNLATVINKSNLIFEKGSNDYGYITYYANKVINNANVIGDFVFENGKKQLSCYIGKNKEITLPSNFNGEKYSIGESAFAGCNEITSVEICNGVTKIGSYAFNGCSSLASVVIGDGVTNIAEGAFINCSSLTSIEIPNSVTNIDKFAFQYSGLVEVELSNGIDELKPGTFAYCQNLKTIAIPESVTQLGTLYNEGWEGVFEGCTSLESIVIPEGVKIIGALTFNRCINLMNVKIPNSVTNIAYGAFMNCFALTGIEVPNSVTSIEESAFYRCSGLTSIEIPDSVTSIGSQTFYGCTSLASLKIPNSVTSIGGSAFISCTSLTSLEIPNSVTSIGGNAFSGCSGLTSLVIPNSVTSIGAYAFEGCSGLTSVISYIPAEDLFKTYSFYGVDKTNCTLYVPYGAKETYASTEGWNEFTNIVELDPTEITVTINQYGSATYCSEYALDFSEVEGLKAYAATGYKSNSGVVTLTRVQTAEGGVGLFLKGEPGEYVVPVIESTDEHSLNMLVGTLESTIVNGIDGEMTNYKYTVKSGTNTPMFYQFADNSTLSAGKAYLQIPTAWLPATAQKSVSIRFDDGETTDIDELKGENGEVKTIYDLQGRVVENPTKGIYIVDGKKVFINK